MLVTLGVEEELQAVDALTGALVPHDLQPVTQVLPNGPGGIAHEMHKCAVELQTPVCSGPDSVLASLSSLRSLTGKRAALQGQSLVAAGLHPFSQWQSQPVHDDRPHYAHLLHEYGDIARSAMSFGLHIHLGLPEKRLRIPVMNALRSVLPEVLALSVNSPFHEGRDTGLACWRHSVLGRYPRMGVPEIYPDEKAYFDRIARLRRVGSLEPDQGMWDDLRLHHRYGTLEVRICDTVTSLERVWLIVALLQCEVATLAQEAAQGKLPEAEPVMWIEENRWRARRHGMDADLVDWARDEAVPTPVRYERWLARLLPVAVKLGLWPRIELAVAAALSERTGADQQRIWHARSESFESLVKTLADATSEPWTVPAPARRIRAGNGKGQAVREPASRPALQSGHALP